MPFGRRYPGGPTVRQGTTIVLAVLLVAILVAATFQLVLLA